MSDFEIWIYRIIIAALAVIVWFGIQRLIAKLDELIKSINALSENYKVQANQIMVIFNQLKDFTSRLNDHAKRIRDIEIKRAKCNNNCDEGD